ncbi:discoidin domain-containing protein [Vibrio penaeicida]|uniref:discoidin domain-containing protein n=1 Tax=Vibrio penaeicida TaxID=104609 RepID=UPI0027339E2C|nr:discoidin domain-containing protein [Vibrio penaeicida]MDP2574623.1 discoidin domain-containing protein [Vibrio penaeicida]
MKCTKSYISATALVFATITAVDAKELGDIDANSIQLTGQTLTLKTTDNEHLKISILSENTFRIQASQTATFVNETVDALLDQCNNFNCNASDFDVNALPTIVVDNNVDNVNVQLTTNSNFYALNTNEISLRIQKSPLTFSLYKQGDPTALWSEIVPISIGQAKTNFDIESLKMDKPSGKTTQTLSSGLEEHFYGGGQQNGEFEFNGKIMEASYSGGWDEYDRPNPAPFFMSDKGYGVLRNTWRNGGQDFRIIDKYTSSYNENRFDAYYFTGDSIKDVVEQYTALTGRPHLMPRWAYYLGDADCYNNKNGYYPQGWPSEPGTTMDVVEQVGIPYKNYDMPIGWILPNDGYGCEYENLSGTINALDDLGIKTGLWTQRSLDSIAQEVADGISVYKLDVAWTGPGKLYSLSANNDAHQGLISNSDTRGMIWTVMGWAGTQRYSIAWTGDQYSSWDYIRWHIPTFIGSGLSGQAYASSDVNGIFGNGAEKYTRDIQFKTFTPVLIAMSGWDNKERKHAWWHDGEQSGKSYRDINRQYLKLKSALTPYLYNYAYEADRIGFPIVRAMTWEFPDDPVLKDETYKYQYMYGESLLVAPVYEPMLKNGGWHKDVYLPEGLWIDYWDGTRTQSPSGGTLLSHYPISIDTMPVLVRAGAIIPMYEGARSDQLQDKTHLILDIYPHGNSQFTLFEDDGETRQYKDQNAFADTSIRVSAPENVAGDITINVDATTVHNSYTDQVTSRSYHLKVNSLLEPLSVRFGNLEMTSASTLDEFNAIEQGWYYAADEKFGTIHIKVPNLSVYQGIEFNIDIDELATLPATPPYPSPLYETDFDKSKITIIQSAKEQDFQPFSHALDGDVSTIYHSPWWPENDGDRLPQSFTIDLGEDYIVSGFTYLPREDAGNGTVTQYRLFLSNDTSNWGEPVSEGDWEVSNELKIARFTAQNARYLKFEALAGVGQFFSAREFDVITEQIEVPLKTVDLTLSNGTAVGNAQQDKAVTGDAMQMNGLSFSGGIGVSAPSSLTFFLDGTWSELNADVGIDDSCKVDGNTVKASIYLNGFKAWEYDIEGPTVVKPNLALTGIRSVELTVEDVDNSTAGDCINWANLRISGPESATFNEINKSDFVFIERPRHQQGHAIENAFDNDPKTMYHSPWNPVNDSERAPQQFVVNLGGTFDVHSFSYLAREGAGNGAIGQYRLSLSLDGNQWTEISSGQFERVSEVQKITFNATKASYLKFEALSGVGDFVSAAEFDVFGTRNTNDFDKSTITIVQAPDFQSSYDLAKAFDNDPTTMYHSPWFPNDESQKAPQSFVIKLGETLDVSGFGYLAREDLGNGTIGQYRISLSMDGTQWREVSAGIFDPNTRDHILSFTPIKANYVRFEALSGRGDFVSAAEFDVIGTRHDFLPENMTFISKPLFQPGSEIEKAFDNNPDTMYHSPWFPSDASQRAPQSFVIKFGDTLDVSGFRYLARENLGNGAIGQYRISLSLDGTQWQESSSGNFDLNTREHTLLFTPMKANYIKFEALSGRGDFVSAAEFDVIGSR